MVITLENETKSIRITLLDGENAEFYAHNTCDAYGIRWDTPEGRELAKQCKLLWHGLAKAGFKVNLSILEGQI